MIIILQAEKTILDTRTKKIGIFSIKIRIRISIIALRTLKILMATSKMAFPIEKVIIKMKAVTPLKLMKKRIMMIKTMMKNLQA